MHAVLRRLQIGLHLVGREIFGIVPPTSTLDVLAGSEGLPVPAHSGKTKPAFGGGGIFDFR